MGLLDQASSATGFQKPQLVKFGFIGLVLFVVFGIGQAIVTNILGVAYPVFMSFHALETDQNKNDDK